METIKIYNGPPGSGPNPWKVAIVLKELNLPWEFVWIPYADLVKEPYLNLNPNGRFPAMVDPNTNVTLFESGAIIQYLVAQYDTKHLISYPVENLQDKWSTDSWLMVQMSGQGPMFGQKMWFTHFHHKKNVETAITRYAEQSRRMLQVIDRHLHKRRQELKLESDTPAWLVGDKCTYADLSFVPWHFLFPALFVGERFEPEKEFPEFFRWSQELNKRQSVAQVIDERTKCMETMENSAAAVLPKRED
ncbi:putative glutathione s-transferase protein [Fusarium austroafricanum]|uniref:Putative glutathione s-transferase protein n=1 Tax=Fusarium austroafricanum TaxID=2364996 RepID=A0A8H4KTC3_9HYPO|nr:putative glutathione s-transferase protein [Fusarium austroafricanum]